MKNSPENITDPIIKKRIEAREISIIDVNPASAAGIQLAEAFAKAQVVGVVEDVANIRSAILTGAGLN